MRIKSARVLSTLAVIVILVSLNNVTVDSHWREPRLRSTSHWKAILSWISKPVQRLSQNKPFYVVWNAPSFRCGRKYGLPMDLEKYGILGNEFELFHGEVINLFYESRLGLYPRYLPDNTSKYGGIPQLANLTAHLEWVKTDIDWYIPNVTYDGLAVIDWESWRPLFKRNWGDKSIYQKASENLVQRKHPSWSQKKVYTEAQKEFEIAARSFMQETLTLCHNLRPRAKWGFYLFPDCYNYKPGEDNCTRIVQERNDRLSWMYRTSSALYPSIYLSYNTYSRVNQRLHVRGILNEAYRVRQTYSSPQLPVIPYARYVYSDTNRFYQKFALKNTIGQSADSGAAGVVLWDSTNNIRSEKQCKQLQTYLSTVLGPYVKRVLSWTERCSESLCNGHGRCVSVEFEKRNITKESKITFQRGPVIKKVGLSKKSQKDFVRPRVTSYGDGSSVSSHVSTTILTTMFTSKGQAASRKINRSQTDKVNDKSKNQDRRIHTSFSNASYERLSTVQPLERNLTFTIKNQDKLPTVQLKHGRNTYQNIDNTMHQQQEVQLSWNWTNPHNSQDERSKSTVQTMSNVNSSQVPAVWARGNVSASDKRKDNRFLQQVTHRSSGTPSYNATDNPSAAETNHRKHAIRLNTNRNYNTTQKFKPARSTDHPPYQSTGVSPSLFTNTPQMSTKEPGTTLRETTETSSTLQISHHTLSMKSRNRTRKKQFQAKHGSRKLSRKSRQRGRTGKTAVGNSAKVQETRHDGSTKGEYYVTRTASFKGYSAVSPKPIANKNKAYKKKEGSEAILLYEGRYTTRGPISTQSDVQRSHPHSKLDQGAVTGFESRQQSIPSEYYHSLGRTVGAVNTSQANSSVAVGNDVTISHTASRRFYQNETITDSFEDTEVEDNSSSNTTKGNPFRGSDMRALSDNIERVNNNNEVLVNSSHNEDNNNVVHPSPSTDSPGLKDVFNNIRLPQIPRISKTKRPDDSVPVYTRDNEEATSIWTTIFQTIIFILLTIFRLFDTRQSHVERSSTFLANLVYDNDLHSSNNESNLTQRALYSVDILSLSQLGEQSFTSAHSKPALPREPRSTNDTRTIVKRNVRVLPRTRMKVTVSRGDDLIDEKIIITSVKGGETFSNFRNRTENREGSQSTKETESQQKVEIIKLPPEKYNSHSRGGTVHLEEPQESKDRVLNNHYREETPTEVYADYVCKCYPGWTGEFCNQKISN